MQSRHGELCADPRRKGRRRQAAEAMVMKALFDSHPQPLFLEITKTTHRQTARQVVAEEEEEVPLRSAVTLAGTDAALYLRLLGAKMPKKLIWCELAVVCERKPIES